MIKTICLTLMVTFLRCLCGAQNTPVDARIPEDLRGCVEAKRFATLYEVDEKLNPFYLRGYFDLDRKSDYAIHVRTNAQVKLELLFA